MFPPPTLSLPYFTILLPWLYNHFPWHSRPQKSVSGTLDRPRVVAPTDLRSCAILQASLALSPVSFSICCTHVRKVVLAGDSTPAWCPVYHLCERPQPGVVWAGVASGSRRTWPKMESRLRQIRIAKPSSPVSLVTGVRDKMEPTDS